LASSFQAAQTTPLLEDRYFQGLFVTRLSKSNTLRVTTAANCVPSPPTRRVQNRLSDVAMTHIDWMSHAQAIRHFQATSTILFVKFLRKWLPVGKKVHRCNPGVYPSQYPSCSCEKESFNHPFRYPDPHCRKWRSDLRRELLQRLNYFKTVAVLADLLIDDLTIGS
jgi:hypothetical protein